MFSLYRHKQKILFSILKEPLTSRYVIAYYPHKLEKDAIKAVYRNRSLKISSQISAVWAALITDDGLHLKYIHSKNNFELTFFLQNETPIMILLAHDDKKVSYFPLSNTDL